MEYITIQKNLSNSPRKMRLVADMVRKMTPRQALNALQFTQNAAALPLSKAIKTVLANASRDDVYFKTIEINEGPKLRRNRVGTAGRGRSRPYKKRWSHIKIVLTDDFAVQNSKLRIQNKEVSKIKNDEINVVSKEKGGSELEVDNKE